jgi:uncharacterized repeat protein (TIGR01451 family)
VLAGASASYTILAVADLLAPGATISPTNTATVTFNELQLFPPYNQASAQVTVLGASPVTLEKVADPTVLGGEQPVEFTISVENVSQVSLTGVTVTDALPAGLTLVSTTGCVEDPVGVPTCSLGTLLAGASASYTILATTDPVEPGEGLSLTNTATVSFNELVLSPPENQASVTVQVVSGLSEVPTATTWSLLALALLLLGGGTLLLRRY